MFGQKMQAIVLAAGKSSRFQTGKSKLVETICGQEMILFSTNLLSTLNIPTTVVLGYQKEQIQEIINKKHGGAVNFIKQQEQHGTGHAVACTQNKWDREHILIMNGDMPLVRQDIIIDLYKKHIEQDAAISFVTSCCTGSNHSYGRVIEDGKTIEIIEAKEFHGQKTEVCIINAGIYLVKKEFLQDSINEIEKSETTKEFYLTDLVKIASDQGLTICTVNAPFDQIRGINNLQELWAAEQVKRAELIKHWMEKGVRFGIAHTVHLELDIEIGPGSSIGCSVHINKGSRIGKNCIIQQNSIIENSILESNVMVHPNSIINNSYISSGASIGPFAYIRENTIIKEQAQVGNFVEVKNTILGSGSKAKHLSYLGNATIGKNVNIGAGTITCNFNGVSKNKTIIEDNVFIGSNNTIVAPVIIQEDSFTAAGSTITENVPKEALAISRTRQINKENYGPKLKKRYEQTERDAKESFIAAAKVKEASTEL